MAVPVHNSAAASAVRTVTVKPTSNRNPGAGDRRTGVDRRKVDALPPGLRDRRRTVDSRKPDVVELDMSDSEWSALTELPPPPPIDPR